MKNENENHPTTSAEQADRPAKLSRRTVLTAGTVGAAAAVATGAMTASVAMAQDAGELAGKTAFVTGGARGIGLAAAEEMAKAGANIVLFDIATETVPNVQYPLATPGDLAAAQAAVEAHGVGCIAYRGDVRNIEEQQDATQQAVDRFGSLDIVVANAGVTQIGRIEDFSPEEIAVVNDINVGGVVKTTQAAAPHLRNAGGGRLIYIASSLGRTGNHLFPVYASTKWAVIGFAKSAATSYGRDNIMCNVVAPGLVRTPLADNEAFLRGAMPDAPNATFDDVSAMWAPFSPLGVGHLEVEDVARSVMFFVGDATRQMTGEVLDVSYGNAAHNIG